MGHWLHSSFFIWIQLEHIQPLHMPTSFHIAESEGENSSGVLSRSSGCSSTCSEWNVLSLRWLCQLVPHHPAWKNLPKPVMIRLEVSLSTACLPAATLGIAAGLTSLMHCQALRETNRRKCGEQRDGGARWMYEVSMKTYGSRKEKCSQGAECILPTCRGSDRPEAGSLGNTLKLLFKQQQRKTVSIFASDKLDRESYLRDSLAMWHTDILNVLTRQLYPKCKDPERIYDLRFNIGKVFPTLEPL